LRSLRVRVRPEDVEPILDRLLPLAPRGAHELAEAEFAELLLYGEDDELAEAERVASASAEALAVETAAAPEDWRERRAQTYRPERIGARLLVRPSWAAPVDSPDGRIEVVLADDDGAFGSGSHPTTRACLEVLEHLPPGGTLADLGCGSGVIAVTAVLLGWQRVVAVDADPGSLEATRANATRNAVELEAVELDLMRQDPPRADAYFANVPLPVHTAIGTRLTSAQPRTIVASGVPEEHTDELVGAYAGLGLEPVRRASIRGWVVVAFGGSG
jgi:ribosomal protein L11 methyltransferase